MIVSIRIIRGYKLGKKELDEEKVRKISGKVIKVFKPENDKIIHIMLSGGLEYAPSFFGLNSIIEVGDSIYKAPNSFKFIIYKKNMHDSTIYIGTNRFYK